MPHRLPWIEQRFAFDLPLSMFPCVVERLRGTPARVEERVKGQDPASLRLRLGVAWSIQENIGHLIELEGLWLGRLDDFAAGLSHLRPAEMSNASTEAADYNSKAGGEVLEQFRLARGHFLRRLEALEASQLERSAHHPRLNQSMRILDLVFFAAEHDDHHLARITEILRALTRGRPFAETAVDRPGS
jgi:uncharacterized damage-inducible protein DinB